MSIDRSARLLALVEAFSTRRVAVVGDIVADEFLTGQISRVSREAPVLILRYDATRVVPGGAGNAANNVAALGGRVDLFGLAGRDEAGKGARRELPPGCPARGILQPPGYRTPTKTRVLAGGIHSAKQQIVRIDREPPGAAPAGSRRLPARPPCSRPSRRPTPCCSPTTATASSRPGWPNGSSAKAVGGEAPAPGRPSSSTRATTSGAYRGLTACTPNEPEVEQLLGVRIDDDPEALERAGRALLRRSRMEAVLVTRGSRGMALFEPPARRCTSRSSAPTRSRT